MENRSLPSGSDVSDWNNHESDEEDLEDIEIALYGMLHHAFNEEAVVDNEEEAPLTEPSVSPSGVSRSIEDSGCKVGIPSESKEMKKLQQEIIDSCKNAVQNGSKELPRPTKSKFFIEREPFVNKQQNRTYQSPLAKKNNPFDEYLVIEHCTDSTESSPHRKSLKAAEVIDISDDEDSKYKSINNIFSKIVPPKNSRNKYSDQEGSSESDSSIVIVNSSDSSSFDSFSDSNSDSEVEIIGQSKLFKKSSKLKLNVSGTGDIDVQTSAVIPAQRSSLHFPVTPDWKKYSCNKWTPDMVEFYGGDIDGPDLDKVADSLPRHARWFVSDSDRFGDLPSLRKNRYFAGKSRIQCLNCNQWDHVARECREPKKLKSCNVCGTLGHNPFQCPNKVCFGVCTTIS